MDRVLLYHSLSATFGLLALGLGVARLLTSVSLTGILFAVVGLGMSLTSALAIARPGLDDTADPATWKLVLLAVGVALFLVGGALELT